MWFPPAGFHRIVTRLMRFLSSGIVKIILTGTLIDTILYHVPLFLPHRMHALYL